MWLSLSLFPRAATPHGYHPRPATVVGMLAVQVALVALVVLYALVYRDDVCSSQISPTGDVSSRTGCLTDREYSVAEIQKIVPSAQNVSETELVVPLELTAVESPVVFAPNTYFAFFNVNLTRRVTDRFCATMGLPSSPCYRLLSAHPGWLAFMDAASADKPYNVSFPSGQFDYALGIYFPASDPDRWLAGWDVAVCAGETWSLFIVLGYYNKLKSAIFFTLFVFDPGAVRFGSATIDTQIVLQQAFVTMADTPPSRRPLCTDMRSRVRSLTVKASSSSVRPLVVFKQHDNVATFAFSRPAEFIDRAVAELEFFDGNGGGRDDGCRVVPFVANMYAVDVQADMGAGGDLANLTYFLTLVPGSQRRNVGVFVGFADGAGPFLNLTVVQTPAVELLCLQHECESFEVQLAAALAVWVAISGAVVFVVRQLRFLHSADRAAARSTNVALGLISGAYHLLPDEAQS